METSGDFYTVLGRALSTDLHFRSANLSCLCEGTVYASALCSVLGSVKPVPNCRWCYCKALPCLSWKAAHLGSSGFASELKGHVPCCAVGSCTRCPHQDTRDQAWLKANSRWTKPNWHSTHITSKTCMSQFVLGKPGLNKPRHLAWCPNSVLCFQ